MENTWTTPLWRQLGAAIDSMEKAIIECPEELWGDQSREPQYWYLVFHTLFFLDLYLEESEVGFAPPSPFGLTEMDPSGILPERVYTKDELLGYLHHGRRKCKALLATLTDDQARAHRRFFTRDYSLVEWLPYTMRHVQHHMAQLNLILRQETGSAPGWVSQAKD